jgi:polo-like kinase 1
LGPSGTRFDYITRRTQEKPETRTTHAFEEYPEELRKKVTLLRHFKNYMLTDSLEKKDGATMGESGLPPVRPGTSAVPRDTAQGQQQTQLYVKKWMRNKHAILFQLCNKIVQVVFFDGTELVLSSKAHMVTYIDKKRQRSTYPLSSALDVPCPELGKRLRYTKDILVNLLCGRPTTKTGGPLDKEL